METYLLEVSFRLSCRAAQGPWKINLGFSYDGDDSYGNNNDDEDTSNGDSDDDDE